MTSSRDADVAFSAAQSKITRTNPLIQMLSSGALGTSFRNSSAATSVDYLDMNIIACLSDGNGRSGVRLGVGVERVRYVVDEVERDLEGWAVWWEDGGSVGRDLALVEWKGGSVAGESPLRSATMHPGASGRERRNRRRRWWME